MRRLTKLGLTAFAVAAPLALLPTLASAETCGERAHNRRVAGTVIGGIGGALIGNAIRKGGTGAVVGGLGGAVIGNQLSRVKCDRGYARSYRSSYARRSNYRAPRRAEPAPQPVRYVYYDRYGVPVSAGPAPQWGSQQYPSTYGQPTYTQAAYNPVSYNASCRTETQAFYDERGSLVYRPMQVCGR